MRVMCQRGRGVRILEMLRKETLGTAENYTAEFYRISMKKIDHFVLCSDTSIYIERFIWINIDGASLDEASLDNIGNYRLIDYVTW